jgi:mono/diheme cytochrome c family protein
VKPRALQAAEKHAEAPSEAQNTASVQAQNDISRTSTSPRTRFSAACLTGSLLWVVACVAVMGCDQLPGKPKPGPEVPRPDQIVDFPTLYSQNCSGCHGDKGMNGSAYPLATPVYQALVDEQQLRQITTNGIPGTLMPAFAISAGGSLTDQQIDVLAKGMHSAWSGGGSDGVGSMPSYKASKPADVDRGQQVYVTYCASCHGEATRTPKADSDAGQTQLNQSHTTIRTGKAGSIVDPSFLALVSDQALRTVVIAGRSDIGQPDWQHYVAGHPMSDQEVTDVVGWLGSMRPKVSGGGSQ